MSWTSKQAFVGTAALAALLFATPAPGAPIGIVNGDFETGSDNDAPPSGWTDLSSSASFWAGVPDETGNPSAADAALAPAPGVGNLFLSTARQSAGVGSQPTDGTLVQTVDLSAFGTDIDNGDQALTVDFIYASGDERDSGAFSLHFFGTTDGSGAELGTGFSQTLDPSGGFFFGGWEEHSVGGLVPVSARSVTLQISSTRTGGSETNIWLDNFTGDIATIPEPASLALLALGSLALTCGRRR